VSELEKDPKFRKWIEKIGMKWSDPRKTLNANCGMNTDGFMGFPTNSSLFFQVY